ncbi:ferritin family protein [bacterium]|nr:ferritin family protein [candidate division CSSED10-310 bacterium]
MANVMTIDEILDFAIDSEQAAIELYVALAATTRRQAMKAVFEAFAEEERKHKKLLFSVKEGNRVLKPGAEPVVDLKISDYTVGDTPDPDADYQTILLFAMKKEKAAFRLYTNLAAQVDDAGVRDMLLGLAQEEAKHKLYFETEYDEVILRDN